MNGLALAILCLTMVGYARNSFTGGYSGAPGRQRCASSCHGGTAGTIVVSGFPTAYQPGQTYTIVVAHNGGSRIVNFNATTRIGSTTTVAGTFATVTNTTLYTGADGGVYANPHGIDTAVFRWTAPAAGAGVVNFYCAGFQGTTTSPNGQSTFITLNATEITTDVQVPEPMPDQFVLGQNYPNPFNSSTRVPFSVQGSGFMSLTVYNVAGLEVATLIRENLKRGAYSVGFDAANLPSGVYLYKLSSRNRVETRRMLLLR